MGQNIRDLSAAAFEQLPAAIRHQVDDFVSRGFERNHLVWEKDRVYYDDGLAFMDSISDVLQRREKPEESR